MKIQEIIIEIRTNLTDTFEYIDTWFDKKLKLRIYKPKNNGWTINQILEHIALTNHFLLILIEKGTKKALSNVNQLDFNEQLQSYTFHREKLNEIGVHKSFDWIRPEHMEPKGEKPLNEVRIQLENQLKMCLGFLDTLKNGEGILFKTTMTVNDLGKIDVYEYLYFLAQHGQRHITQMIQNELEFGDV